MPETTVQCPGCKARLRLKAVAKGKTHVGCPKCGARVPLAPPEEEEEEIPTVEAVEEEEEEALPARRGRRRRDADDAEEEERPRPKKKRKKQGPPLPRPLLWALALGGCLVGVILTFVVLYGIQEGKGFPPPEEGPAILKPIVLLVFLAVGVGIMLYGCYGIVYQRITIVRRVFFFTVGEEHYQGATAIVFGIGQCIAGAIAAGAGLYGLVM